MTNQEIAERLLGIERLAKALGLGRPSAVLTFTLKNGLRVARRGEEEWMEPVDGPHWQLTLAGVAHSGYTVDEALREAEATLSTGASRQERALSEARRAIEVREGGTEP